MTFLSVIKHGENHKVLPSIITLCALMLSTMLFSASAYANSCSRADIEYYLQRGFTNAQVVQLCAEPNTTQNTSQQTYQAPTQQSNSLREDESYLSAALDADGVKMSTQQLVLLPRECIEYGPPNNTDLIETICVNTKLTVNFAGLQIGKAKKGIFLVRDATIDLKGNIQRELVGLSELRRQDREAIQETLSSNPKGAKIKLRRGIDPGAVAQRLKKYAR